MQPRQTHLYRLLKTRISASMQQKPWIALTKGIMLYLTLGVLVSFQSLPAQAFFPFKNRVLSAANNTNDTTAPEATILKEDCEPYRLQVQEINQKSRFYRTFHRVQRYQLKKKYRKCHEKFYKQEYQYLKNVSINMPANWATLDSDVEPASNASQENQLLPPMIPVVNTPQGYDYGH